MTVSRNFRIRAPMLAAVWSLCLCDAGTAAPSIAAVDATPEADAVQLAAMDDLPTVPQRQRRGGGRRAKAKDNKPYQPLSKDVQGESAEAHKDYLKRYGF